MAEISESGRYWATRSEPYTRSELDEYLAEQLVEERRKMNAARNLPMRMYHQGQLEALGRCRLMVRAGRPFLP